MPSWEFANKTTFMCKNLNSPYQKVKNSITIKTEKKFAWLPKKVSNEIHYFQRFHRLTLPKRISDKTYYLYSFHHNTIRRGVLRAIMKRQYLNAIFEIHRFHNHICHFLDRNLIVFIDCKGEYWNMIWGM